MSYQFSDQYEADVLADCERFGLDPNEEFARMAELFICSEEEQDRAEYARCDA